MQAFASSRLAGGAGRIGVIAPLVPAQQMRSDVPDKKAAKSAALTGQKRKRTVTTDALFAEEDDEEDAAEEEVSAPASAKSRSATSRSKVPPPQPAQRSKHRASLDDDESGGDDNDGGEGGEDDGASKKRRNAPEERGFKKPVSAGLTVTALPAFNVEKKRRDPRFDPMCGEYNPLHFHSHYQFITEEKEAEIAQWQKELRAGKSSAPASKGQRMTDEEREELRVQIQRAQQELQRARREHGEQSLLQKWKSAERKAQKETGKKAFFLKDSEKKKLQLAARFMDLKQAGGLNKFMEKKNKQVANRDHRYMPHEGRE